MSWRLQFKSNLKDPSKIQLNTRYALRLLVYKFIFRLYKPKIQLSLVLNFNSLLGRNLKEMLVNWHKGNKVLFVLMLKRFTLVKAFLGNSLEYKQYMKRNESNLKRRWNTLSSFNLKFHKLNVPLSVIP